MMKPMHKMDKQKAKARLETFANERFLVSKHEQIMESIIIENKKNTIKDSLRSSKKIGRQIEINNENEKKKNISIKVITMFTITTSLISSLIFGTALFLNHWVTLKPMPGVSIEYEKKGRNIQEWSRSLWTECVQLEAREGSTQDDEDWKCVTKTLLLKSFSNMNDGDYDYKLFLLVRVNALLGVSVLVLSFAPPVLVFKSYKKPLSFKKASAFICSFILCICTFSCVKMFLMALDYARTNIADSKMARSTVTWGKPMYGVGVSLFIMVMDTMAFLAILLIQLYYELLHEALNFQENPMQ